MAETGILKKENNSSYLYLSHNLEYFFYPIVPELILLQMTESRKKWNEYFVVFIMLQFLNVHAKKGKNFIPQYRGDVLFYGNSFFTLHFEINLKNHEKRK